MNDKDQKKSCSNPTPSPSSEKPKIEQNNILRDRPKPVISTGKIPDDAKGYNPGSIITGQTMNIL